MQARPLAQKPNTRVQESPNGECSVWLHGTEIVRANPDWIVLRTDGHWTVTTKRRMNEASKALGLRFNVHSLCRVWRVTVWSPTGVWLAEHSFKGDGMRFNRHTGALG